jgi:diguanylate cyclase (GGDEF)-like protein/PAS domain S-box-containing protein
MVDGPAEVEALPRPPAAVLIVNDRLDQRVAIGAMLASLDVDVVEAESGRDALRAVLRHTFALILMDVRMPGMDGYETAALIRQRHGSSRTPIIFLTAYGREDDRQSLVAYASGAIDFIYTPVVPDVLLAKVSAFVDLFLQSEELQRSLDSINALNTTLRDLQASTQAVLDNVADGIVAVSEGGLIESLNPSARALFGYREEEVIGQPLSLVIAPARRDEFCGSSNGAPGLLTVARAQNRAVETVGRHEDGSVFAMEVEHGEMKRGDQHLTLAFVRDISERKAYNMIEHQALHDGLTGLPNRTLFGEHVVQALASAKRNGESRALLMMDLDGFKQVNDTLGHDRGDVLLQQVVTRLAGVSRETDTIARLGGDEFAILPGGPTDLDAAAAVARTIQRACVAEFKLTDAVVHVSASIGIALFPDHGTTTEELLRRADAAMYVAKRSGSGYAVFDTTQETEAAHQLELLADLRQCITREELVLHYQPKIDLATGEISGVEALIRWQHPIQGLLAPPRFLADVERTSLIEPVTRWVLNEALRQQRSWRDRGLGLTMAVNISAHSLRPNSHLPDIVAELTDVWETTPDRLTLELSEGALIEAPSPGVLDRLHAMGVRISIDDFGIGYSSLAYLQRLPVDEIKIHTSFVTTLADDTDSDNAIIVRAIIDLAHDLGLSVVAEGVEEQIAMDLLVEYGCDSVQGCLLGRPSPVEDLDIWLTESPYAAQLVGDR